MVLVPQDLERETTFEDDSITSPEERARVFGQYDHRRIYGCDYDDRLREAGFRVERIACGDMLSLEERRLYAVGNDDIVVVYKD